MTAGNISRTTVIAIVMLAPAVGRVAAGQGRGTPTPAPSAKASAPIDLTGYWVSIVNKDWRVPVVIPAQGGFFCTLGGNPTNAEAGRGGGGGGSAEDGDGRGG